MKLLIKFPTRGRREVFQNTFESYYSMLSGKHEVEFRISMDVDDKVMNRDDVWSFLDEKKNITYCYGENTCKVGAINANMDGAEFDVLLLASDDMIPQVHGYDDIIITKMQEHFPEMDGALHFNDGRAAEALCTLSIMGKKMYDRFGYIYHPQYTSLWCDNEFHEVCHSWGKMKYVDNIIIKHAWVDATGSDNLHQRNESFHDADKIVYTARKNAGFPKEHVVIERTRRSREQRRKENAARRRG